MVQTLTAGLTVEGHQLVPIEMGRLPGQRHQNIWGVSRGGKFSSLMLSVSLSFSRKVQTFDDAHPNGASWEEEMEVGVMELVEVERVESLLGCDQDVLVPGFRVDPGRRPVNAQRAAVEYFGEAGAHVHLGRRRQAVARHLVR